MKKKFEFPSTYTVLLIITVAIALLTQFIPNVIPASFNDVLFAPVNGMVGIKDLDVSNNVNEAMQNGGISSALEALKNQSTQYVNVSNNGELSGAIGVALFILVIGGFLGVATKTGALDAGIAAVVKKLKGKELLLIPILMIIFSIGGSSYGMAEESLAFYALVTSTMLMAGFDPLVAASTVLLGAGCGVLGSTVNPFAIGVAMSSAEAVGVTVNKGVVMLLGLILWIVTVGISIFFVMRYAKKVHHKSENSLLSEKELDEAKKQFSSNQEEEIAFTGKRKLALVLFAISFIVMIISLIPWETFGITWFAEHTGMLTGVPLGEWYFSELTVWFFIMSILLAVLYGLKEKETVDAFVAGAADMVGVALVLGVSRGVSFLMSNTGLDLYILDNASNVLNGMSQILFINIAFVIFIGLSFLIPSSSGLATLSMPIFAPLANALKFSPEVVIIAFSAASGLVNLVTPTSGAVMGGLAISKVEYSTWLKFVGKILFAIFVACAIILSVAIMLF